MASVPQFVTWLRGQHRRTDSVGSLAKIVVADGKTASLSTAQELSRRLNQDEAEWEMHEALEQAESEWRQEFAA